MVSHNPKKPQTKQRGHESWSIVVDSRLVIKIGLLGSFMRNPNRFFEGFCLILCLVTDLSLFSNVLQKPWLLPLPNLFVSDGKVCIFNFDGAMEA